MKNDKDTLLIIVVFFLVAFAVRVMWQELRKTPPLSIRGKAEILYSHDYNDLDYEAIEKFATTWDEYVEDLEAEAAYYEERSYYDY